MSQNSYSSRMRRATWLAFGVPIAVAAGISVLLRSVSPGEQFWLVFPALLIGGALAFWACLPWWNRMDDMQKHGHLVSWYWGGFPGGVAVLLALVASAGIGSDLAEGAGLVIAGQGIAFLLFFAVWSLRRRGPEA